MHFDLSDEQKQFSEGVERLLSANVDLTAMTKGADVIGPVRAKLEPLLAELGATAVLVSEENGGLDMGLLTLAVLAEAFGKCAAPTNVLQSALAAWVLSEGGNDAVREQWLEALMSGGATAAFAFNEGPGVWSPDNWRARKAGEVRKLNVEGARDAKLIIAGLADGTLVALDGADVTVEADIREPLDMTRPVANITFEGAAGKPLGAGLAPRLYDAMLVLAAADAAAAGRAAYQMAVEYAKVREQFDRPIGSFQALKHQLANMAVDIEPAKFLCWYAAHSWDGDQEDAPRMAALAKSHACDVAVKTARASTEAHGGIGYTWEYPLHMLLKRAMHDRMLLGSSTNLRRRVAQLTPDRASA
jgi:alkylation response protein AidB-like acyl-CoA dehydrogenase